MLTTYKDLYQEVTRNVGLDSANSSWVELAKKWTNQALLERNNRRGWPWIMKRGSFRTVAIEDTGTATVTQDSRTVTGSGTSFSSAKEGR